MPGVARDVVLAIIGNTLTIVPLALLRAEGRWKPYVLFNMIRFVALLGLNGWLLIFEGWGIKGITTALWITNVGSALLFLPVLWGKIPRERFYAGWKSLVRYGMPLIAIDVTLYTLNGVPQIMLNHLNHDSTQVALFGFALRIAFLAQIAVVMPFTVAFAPQLFRAQKEEKDPRHLYARTMGYIWTIAVGIALAVVLMTPELSQLLGKNPIYHQSASLVLPLAFATAFYGIFIVFSSGANLKDKTWLFPFILLAGIGLQVITGFFLIPGYSALGAAWTAFAGYFFLSSGTYLANQLIYPIHFPWKRVSLVAVWAVGSLLMYILFKPYFSGFIMRAVLVLLFPTGLIVSGYLDQGERQVLAKFLNKKSV